METKSHYRIKCPMEDKVFILHYKVSEEQQNELISNLTVLLEALNDESDKNKLAVDILQVVSSKATVDKIFFSEKEEEEVMEAEEMEKREKFLKEESKPRYDITFPNTSYKYATAKTYGNLFTEFLENLELNGKTVVTLEIEETQEEWPCSEAQ